MSTVVDTLITRYKLDNSDYKAKAKETEKATKDVGDSAEGMAFGFDLATSAIATTVAALIGFTAASAGFVAESVRRFASFEKSRIALLAYAGSVEEVARQEKILREVAKSPALGFREAMDMSVRLQAAGMDFDMSARAMIAFGNALASSGRGKEELEGVSLALSQIISKGRLSAEELNQLRERGLNVNPILSEAFGTADPEAISKMGVTAKEVVRELVAGFEKLPQMAGGVQNAFDNMGDAVDQIFIKTGDQIAKRLMPVLNEVGRIIEFIFQDGGQVDRIAKAWGELFGVSGKAVIAGLLGDILVMLEEIPKLIGNVAKAGTALLRGDFAGAAAAAAAATVVGLGGMAKRRLELDQEFLAFRPSGPPVIGEGGFRDDAPAAAAAPQVVPVLQQIERNTREVADDIGRSILGGSRRGAAAVNAVNLSAASRGTRGGGAEARVVSAIGVMVEEMVAQRLRAMGMA